MARRIQSLSYGKALMPNDSTNVIHVEFSTEFKRNLRVLAKKYRHIRSDVQPIIAQLQKGDIVGDQVSGTGYRIFKVRVKNSDLRKGKRAGYRVIYYVKTPLKTILITIYAKSDRSTISSDQIRRIVTEFDREL